MVGIGLASAEAEPQCIPELHCAVARDARRGRRGEARRDARHRRAQEFYEGRVVGERGMELARRERGRQETANKRGQERKKGDKGAKRLSVLDRSEGGLGSYAHCFFTSRVLRCCEGERKGKERKRILNAILEFQYTRGCIYISFDRKRLIYFRWYTILSFVSIFARIRMRRVCIINIILYHRVWNF